MVDEVEYMLMVDSAVQVLDRMCPLPWLSKSERENQIRSWQSYYGN